MKTQITKQKIIELHKKEVKEYAKGLQILEEFNISDKTWQEYVKEIQQNTNQKYDENYPYHNIETTILKGYREDLPYVMHNQDFICVIDNYGYADIFETPRSVTRNYGSGATF